MLLVHWWAIDIRWVATQSLDAQEERWEEVRGFFIC